MIRLPEGRYFGTLSPAIRAGAADVTYTRHAPGERAPDHCHDRAYLCIVTDGAFVERSAGQSVECGPGSVLWHPPGALHSDEFSSRGAQCTNLELDAGWVTRLAQSGARIDGPRAARGGDAAWLGARIHEETRHQDPLSAITVEGLVTALLAILARMPNRAAGRPVWVDQIVRRLRHDFVRVPSLDELSHEVGVQRGHVARAFRQHMGCSVGEYARRLRVEWACGELLREPRARLASIGLAAGFADQAHFTRTFKRMTGTTPRRYRLLHRR